MIEKLHRLTSVFTGDQVRFAQRPQGPPTDVVEISYRSCDEEKRSHFEFVIDRTEAATKINGSGNTPL
jgi:hypothetical protein